MANLRNAMSSTISGLKLEDDEGQEGMHPIINLMNTFKSSYHSSVSKGTHVITLRSPFVQTIKYFFMQNFMLSCP